MNFEIMPNGDLKLKLDGPEDKEEVSDMLERATHKDHGFLADILEANGWPGNSQLYQVAPELIGALTDAPILTDEMEHPDDSDPVVRGTVWWYPNYAVRSFGEELLEHGEVVFTLAPSSDNEEKVSEAATSA